jgi:small subunit ribosomal protein S19
MSFLFFKKLANYSTKRKRLISKAWSRSAKIIPELVGIRLKIHNGKDFFPLSISNDMVGHKMGEFIWTRARFEFKKKKKKKRKKISMENPFNIENSETLSLFALNNFFIDWLLPLLVLILVINVELLFLLKPLFSKNWVSFRQTSSYRILVGLTLLNSLFYCFHLEPVVFILRQLALLIWVGFYLKNQHLFSEINSEDAEVRLLLRRHYPIFKYEPYIMVLALLGIFVQVTYTVNALLQLLAPFVMFVYGVMLLLKVLFILGTPEIREVYKKALISPTNMRKRMFSTFSKAAIHGCKLCLQAGVGFGFSAWIGPKFYMGDYDYRGAVWNKITGPLAGYTSRSEQLCREANYLCLYDKNAISKVTDSNGMLNKALIDQQYQVKGIAKPVTIVIEHRFPWSKK